MKQLERKAIEYKYNEEGVLLHKKTGNNYKHKNHEEYEKVSSYITKYIQYLLISSFDLIPMYVPSKSENNFFVKDTSIPQCVIYATKDFQINSNCLVLIQGTGNVRAGIWARSVCINESLMTGSMYPYIEKAVKQHWSVIILNPNERNGFDEQKDKKIKEFPSMESHCLYVYNNIIKKNKNIEKIYIVAHSMGGECTMQILKNNEDDLLSGKIKKIAFTDSVHGSSYKILSVKGKEILKDIARDFVASMLPLGELVKKADESYNGVDCYSSGHPKHEYTSGYAIEEVFKFFAQ